MSTVRGQSRWSTLDRIVSVEPGASAQAVRNVPNTLSIFDSHFPRFPVLPGILILASLGELAAVLLETEGTGPRWRLAGAEQIRFRHFVGPGDQMELNVQLKDLSGSEATLAGDARVDGKVVTQARRLRMVADDA